MHSHVYGLKYYNTFSSVSFEEFDEFSNKKSNFKLFELCLINIQIYTRTITRM